MTITPKRIEAYTAAASTFGDVRGTLTAVLQISDDLAVLRSEGRSNAAKGAEHLLDGCLRRLCATAASSGDEAEQKIEVLERFRQSRYAGKDATHLPMAAMLEAAIAFEAESWPDSASWH